MADNRGFLGKVKAFLLKYSSRKTLIFLFFCILSGFFWMMLSLNEIMEKDVAINVTLTGIPHDVVITSDETDTVRLTLRDKGYQLGAYLFGNKLKPIAVKFSTYANDNGRVVIPAAELLRIISKQLYGSTQVVAMKPDKLEFFFNYGANKRVPVRFQGKVNMGDNYYLSATRIMPDSVTIYANDEQLEQIQHVNIEPLNIDNMTDTVRTTAKIERPKGVKAVPPKVNVELHSDVMTEKTIEVPIKCINIPENKVLRTFPSKVPVRFVVGAGKYRTITAEGFLVVADYEELSSTPGEKCKLYLKATPNGVTNARLEINSVDYLIEN